MLRKVTYPAVRRSTAQFSLHGTTVPDPYDWLEDPESPDTKAFVDAQNTAFRNSIGAFEHSDTLKKYMTSSRDYPRVGAPAKGGADGSFYFHFNSGLQNQAVLMRLRKGLAQSEPPEVFLDPNAFSADGTVALGSTGWSDSRRYYAHGRCSKGSDWNTVHVLDAETGATLPDVIKWVKFSGIAWYRDLGFFYTRFPEPQLAEGQDAGTETGQTVNGSVYFHRLGEPQELDALILKDPAHPNWIPGVGVSDDSKYLIASWRDGCEPQNLLWVAPVPEAFAAGPTPAAADWQWNKVVDAWTAEYDYMANNGSVFYFRSTQAAPQYCVLQLRLGEQSIAEAAVVVPEGEFPLEFAEVVGQHVLLGYLEHVKHVLYIAKLDAPRAMHRIDLPIASIVGLSCRRDSPFVALKVSSFVLPGRSYYFEVADGMALPPAPVVFRDEGPAGFNGDDFVVEQHFFKSASGEKKVPMFVCRHKSVEYDGQNPTLLYGYGGFSISITPSFSVNNFVWMKHFKACYCVANIRGGGEYGKAWHDAGKREHKQNCYTDFCAAARFLHDDLKVTSPSKTAIMGGSNGGLLVSACALREPHLFRSVVAAVGVLDMYKFHRFSIGAAWRSDFGDPDVEAQFRVLQQYSPLHNVRANVQYPAMLITTGDHDDRVVPLHSHKFVATLQATSPDFGGPFLERVEVAAGHGAGKPTSKVIDEACDTYSFLALSLGATFRPDA